MAVAKYPEGLFVQVSSLPSDAGEVRKWFERIEDHRRLGFQFYMTVLTLENIATGERDENGVIKLESIRLCDEQLDWIKDYLPHFNFLFVGGITLRQPSANWDPNREGILDDNFRWANIFAARDAANLFIQYLRDRNITTRIHWYINYEADLNYFADSDGVDIKDRFKWYIMQVTKDLTEISLNNGLNEPEFFWSPYFGRPYNSLTTSQRSMLINGIRDILDSVPRLGWLHFQDGVGGHAFINPDGTITYGFTAQDAINYYQKVLVPASGGNLRSGLINMEYFVFDKDRNIFPGYQIEHENRLFQYRQANIPVGVSWEVRWWYKSLHEPHFAPLPDVIDLSANSAKTRIQNLGFVPIIDGSGAVVRSMSPLSGSVVALGSQVRLILGPVSHL